MYDALPTPASLQVVTSRYGHCSDPAVVLPRSAECTPYSRPRHRWLLTGSKGSTDSTLARADKFRYVRPSFPRWVLPLILHWFCSSCWSCWLACFGRLRIGQNPASLQKGTTPLARVSGYHCYSIHPIVGSMVLVSSESSFWSFGNRTFRGIALAACGSRSRDSPEYCIQLVPYSTWRGSMWGKDTSHNYGAQLSMPIPLLCSIGQETSLLD